MAAGQHLRNSATGEQIVFRKRAADTGSRSTRERAAGIDGRLDRKGRPSPLQMAALLHEFRHELQMPWLPGPLQRPLLGALAAIAARRGYRGAYGS